jgi:prepilin-type N-terminal cleavage/methylation domain-containing protein
VTVARRLLRRLGGEERGYSLIELLATMVILSVVLGALTNIFVTGSHAELDMNKRFQAQQGARLALDRIRTDIHCAASVTIGTIAALGDQVQISEPNCSAANGGQSTVTWCVLAKTGYTPTRYTLYRENGTACDATNGSLIADFLNKNGGVFSYSAAPAGQLQRVTVDFPVEVSTTGGIYDLNDKIVLRNSTRS